MDDFKDDISNSDVDEAEAGTKEERDMARGIMTEEMVNELNFGVGTEDRKKSREERHKEIMEKSKAYKYHAQEIRHANQDAIAALDEDWKDVAGLLNFSTKKRAVEPEWAVAEAEEKGERLVPGMAQAREASKNKDKDKQRELFDDVLKELRGEGIRKIEPAGMPGKNDGDSAEPTEKDKAIKRREHLERLQALADQKGADDQGQDEQSDEDQIDTGSAPRPISQQKKELR